MTGAAYRPVPELAPTIEMLDDYKRGIIDWPSYEHAYLALLDERDAGTTLRWMCEPGSRVALLCSEETAQHCHRKLAADYLAAAWNGVRVRHL